MFKNALVAAALLGIVATIPAAAQTFDETWTYQAVLSDQNGPVNGDFEFGFVLWDDETTGSPQGLAAATATVTNGLVQVPVDLTITNALDGRDLWIAVQLRPDTGDPNAPFTFLTPRQKLTPAPYSIYANTTRGLDVDASDNIGVGTNTPAAKMEIVGPTVPQLIVRQSADSGADGGIVIRGSRFSSAPDVDVAYLELRDYDETEGPGGTDFAMARIAGGQQTTSGQKGLLRFATNDGAGVEERMRITSDGRVGVNVEDPVFGQFEVRQSVNDADHGLTVSRDDGNGTLRMWVDDGGKRRIDAGSGGGGIVAINANGSGTLGIGTSAPAGTLHVAKGSNPDITFQNDGSEGTTRSVSVNFDHSNGTGAQISATRANTDADGMDMSFSTQKVGGTLSERVRIGTNGDVTFNNEAGVRRMLFDPNQPFFQPDGHVKGYAPDGATATVAIDFGRDSAPLDRGGHLTLKRTTGETIVRLGDSGAVEGRSGFLTLYSSDGSQRATLLGQDAGGTLQLKNGTDSGTLDLRADAGDGGSLVTMRSAAGIDTITLDGDDLGGGLLRMRNSADNETVYFTGDNSDAGLLILRTPTQSEILLFADYDGNGTSRIITDVLEIRGADLSERFDIRGDQDIQAGMVVSIDPTTPGGLVIADQAYDRKVAGIVSGGGDVRTGLVMGQDGTLADGEHAVALTGRVWCYVDAGFGAVEPGDRLTTSATPGYAMKVADVQAASGAVIGKAMTGLESGTGMVLVLVQPQ